MKNVYQISFIILFWLLTQTGTAQLQIITNYSKGSSVTLIQINDFSIYNSSNSGLNSLVEVTITDNQTGNRVLYEYSSVLISTGLNSLLPIKFTQEYSDNPVSKELLNSGILKNGIFSICILIRPDNTETPTKLCDQIYLINTREIHLVAPSNEEEIETLNPFLQWMSSYEAGTLYHLRLVQLYPYNANEQALSENIPLFEYDTRDLTCLYPFTSPILEYKKKYVWQVYALSDEHKIIGYSEPWRFIPIKRQIQENQKSDCYRLVHKELNNGNYLFDDVIKFGYVNKANENILSYSITDITTGRKCNNLPLVNLLVGLNKVDIVLGKSFKIEKGHAYMVEIKNKYKERYQFSFMTTKSK